MPVVNGKHFPYTEKGRKAAKKAAKMRGSKKGDPSKTRPGDEDYEAHKGTKSKDHPGDKPDYTTGARKGDKGAGKKKGDKPDYTTGARKGDKSKTHKGKDFEEAYSPMYEALVKVLNEAPAKKSSKPKKGKIGKSDPSYGETAGKMQYRNTMNRPMEEDSDWIQKAVNPKHKGYCTPMTKSTCTPARKALAKRFKKAGRKEKKEGGTGWQGKV